VLSGPGGVNVGNVAAAGSVFVPYAASFTRSLMYTWLESYNSTTKVVPYVGDPVTSPLK